MNAFSLKTARRIIGQSTLWALPYMPQHPSFPAYAALCERYLDCPRDVLSLIGSALELGVAIGTHNERARRRGETITAEKDTSEAAEIVELAKEKRCTALSDTSSVRYQMLKLIINIPNNKVQVVNRFLSAFLKG